MERPRLGEVSLLTSWELISYGGHNPVEENDFPLERYSISYYPS
jgi:hypothetical protein